LIKREEAKLKRIKEAYLNGIDTIEEYKTNKAKITAEIEKLKAKQKKPEPKPELETRRIEFIKLFDNGNATPAELNAALKAFIAYIIYDRPNDNITLFLNP
jgi:predicted  nucleic acid-binding Zn-ribbon protein